jgi:hypothetical protein
MTEGVQTRCCRTPRTSGGGMLMWVKDADGDVIGLLQPA